MIVRVHSGGQTGADRAGLDAAKALGIPTGGYAPRGYRTENGPDPSLIAYGLKETVSTLYNERTEHNVRLSDTTLWFGRANTPGYYATKAFTTQYETGWIRSPSEADLRMLWTSPRRYVVNVAGNRESKNPGIYQRTYDRLLAGWRLPV